MRERKKERKKEKQERKERKEKKERKKERNLSPNWATQGGREKEPENRA